MTDLFKRLFLLSILGIIVSAYLVYHHENIVGGYNLGQSFCNIGGKLNCDDVAKNPYSSFLGFPVACFGLFYFLSLAFISICKKKNEEATFAYIALASLLALIPSLFLLLISTFQIKKFCIFCILLDLIIVSLLALTFRYLKRSYLLRIRDLFNLSLFLYLPFGLLISFSLPWIFKNYVLEAALKEAVIGKIYEQWQAQPEQNLSLNLEDDLMRRDFSLGSKEAKITMVEFSDFQCPFCQIASKEVKLLAKRWPKDLRIVFKNFALDTLCNLRFEQAPHQLACQAAVMARCAGLSGEDEFWKFHDQLFNLTHEDWSLETLLKLSNPEINSCVAEGKVLARVREDSELGNIIGIQSTPSFFINGKRVLVNRLDQLEKLIELILSKS